MTAAATMTAGMYFYAYFCLNVDVFLLYLLLLFYALGRPTNVCGRQRWMVGWLVGVCMEGCLSGWLFFLAPSSFLFAIFFLNTSFLKTSEKTKQQFQKINSFTSLARRGLKERWLLCFFFGNLDANQQARVISHHIYTWNTFWKKQMEKMIQWKHTRTHTLLNTAQKLSQKKPKWRRESIQLHFLTKNYFGYVVIFFFLNIFLFPRFFMSDLFYLIFCCWCCCCFQ